MSVTTVLPLLTIERSGREAVFSGSWYRGEHTNWIPSKADLREADAVERFILQGWLPAAPFITKDTRITAFGSCFAQHISEHLIERGYRVAGRDLELDTHIIRFGEGMVNTFAIRQQFEWALGRRDIPENLWFGEGKEIAAVDPEVRRRTREIIQDTEVFVITLGLSEIWWDKVAGEAFWRAIPADLFDSEKHEFRLSTVQENADNIEAVLGMIRELGARAVITLSPIPLMATFRPISCLTANSVSKAILRIAIDQTIKPAGEDVFYFPSYEILHHMFDAPLEEDNRHPRREVLDAIMAAFERNYCTDEFTSTDRNARRD